MSNVEPPASLFPLFLKLEGKSCLVVGAGPIGLEKVESLLRCGAQVRVIAPEAVPQIQQLSADGKIEWVPRRFTVEDAAAQMLIIAATSDRDVNRAVFEEASRRSILCNTADDPPLCDFFFASTVQRGGLQVAISTAGESPALAQRLRRELDAQLPADLAPWLQELGGLRREVLAGMPALPERKLLLHELAHRQLCALPQCPARQTVAEAVAEYRPEVSR